MKGIPLLFNTYCYRKVAIITHFWELSAFWANYSRIFPKTTQVIVNKLLWIVERLKDYGSLENFSEVYSEPPNCVQLVFLKLSKQHRASLDFPPIHFHPRYKPYHKLTKFTNWDRAINFKHHCVTRQRRMSKMCASAYLKELLADTYRGKLSLCCHISAFGLRSQIEDTMIRLKPQSCSGLIGLRHCSTSDSSPNDYLELAINLCYLSFFSCSDRVFLICAFLSGSLVKLLWHSHHCVKCLLGFCHKILQLVDRF